MLLAGITVYSRGWTILVLGKSTLWCGKQVCLLILLISSDCPGPVARDFTKLCVWLSSVYENNPLGLDVV
jgi:hypothetical protein